MRLNLTRRERVLSVAAGLLVFWLTTGEMLASWIEPDRPVYPEGELPVQVHFDVPPFTPETPEPLPEGVVRI